MSLDEMKEKVLASLRDAGDVPDAEAALLALAQEYAFFAGDPRTAWRCRDEAFARLKPACAVLAHLDPLALAGAEWARSVQTAARHLVASIEVVEGHERHMRELVEDERRTQERDGTLSKGATPRVLAAFLGVPFTYDPGDARRATFFVRCWEAGLLSAVDVAMIEALVVRGFFAGLSAVVEGRLYGDADEVDEARPDETKTPNAEAIKRWEDVKGSLGLKSRVALESRKEWLARKSRKTPPKKR